MRIYDIIAKKRYGFPLSDEEIRFFIDRLTGGEVPDYQASALLMAICINGMNRRETAALTAAMAESGDKIDLSAIPGVKADKHSTGGVGDKTTLIAGPMAAACGLCVAKMSGRGLGHTGGTIDKLESIPGFNASVSRDVFLRIASETGICVAGQSGNLAPADKKLYAIRDVTATVESIPLIASSIMSKKLAMGADCLVLDVKTGSGALMRDQNGAEALAREMVMIGNAAGLKTVALLTDMDRPLGRSVGNALEVIEAVETLRGEEASVELTELCVAIAANMLSLAGGGGIDECESAVRNTIRSGAALEKLRGMVAAQGGDVSYIDDPSKFSVAGFELLVTAGEDAYITAIDTRAVGVASVTLGAGRARAGDPVDHAAGIVLSKTVGDLVCRGEPVAALYSASENALADAAAIFRNAVTYGEEAPGVRPVVLARITPDDGGDW